MGSVGVTGTSAANALAEEADLVLAVGTRLQDFTTGSWALFKNERMKIVGLNMQPFDAAKHGALPLVADAQGRARSARRGARRAGQRRRAWTETAQDGKGRMAEGRRRRDARRPTRCRPTRR